MTTKDDIEKLAGIVAREAAATGVDLSERVEALKELNRFYDILCKTNSGKLDTLVENGPSFEEFREPLKESANGATQVRSRRGTGRPPAE